jgi:hypothetical protein
MWGTSYCSIVISHNNTALKYGGCSTAAGGKRLLNDPFQDLGAVFLEEGSLQQKTGK